MPSEVLRPAIVVDTIEIVITGAFGFSPVETVEVS